MVIIALLVAALSFLLLILIGAFSGSSDAPQPAVAPLDDPQSFGQLMADLMWTK